MPFRASGVPPTQPSNPRRPTREDNGEPMKSNARFPNAAIAMCAGAFMALGLLASPVATGNGSCLSLSADETTFAIDCSHTLTGSGTKVQLKDCNNGVCDNVGAKTKLGPGSVTMLKLTGAGQAAPTMSAGPATAAELSCEHGEMAVGLVLSLGGAILDELKVQLKVDGAMLVNHKADGATASDSSAVGACIEAPST